MEYGSTDILVTKENKLSAILYHGATPPSARLIEWIALAGFRLHQQSIADPLEGDGQQYILLLDDQTVDFDALVRIDRHCAVHSIPLLAICTAETLEPAFIALASAPAEFAMADQPAEIIMLLSQFAHRPIAALHEQSEDKAQRIRNLSENIARLARQLVELSEAEANDHQGEHWVADPSASYRGQSGKAKAYGSAKDDAGRSGQSGETGESGHWPPSQSERAAIIRRMIALRQIRASAFEPMLFADPAWDMLLDLYAAQLEDKKISISSLCLASGVPNTTALRWIKMMTKDGLFERRDDPNDKRRVYIALSDETAEKMEDLLANMASKNLLMV